MATPDMGGLFSQAAQWTARQCGRAYTFAGACFIILIWAVTGPVFHYSDTWQLIINTGTTIVTFLMVFLMQNTQNRDTAAVQLKLDELIRANEKARNTMLSLDHLTEEQLDQLKATFVRLAEVPEAAAHELHEVREDLAEVGEKVVAAQSRIQTVESVAAAVGEAVDVPG